MKPHKKIFFKLKLFIFLSIKKQIKGNIKNPNGAKKYGGNNKAVAQPTTKNITIFN